MGDHTCLVRGSSLKAPSRIEANHSLSAACGLTARTFFKTRSIMAISSGPMFPWDQSRCRLRSLSCLLAGCRGGFACAMLCWLEARLLQRRKAVYGQRVANVSSKMNEA
ncbi:MAG: hypothetical protein E5X98_16245 [Mesorhizobium sp.]|nr:MAG: hypothetical protein E5X98_16245 [Mesorhizobium sp.]